MDDQQGSIDFKNHKMRKSLPEDLVPRNYAKDKNDYRSFLLTLSVIFNDFKDLTTINDSFVRIYRKPPQTETSHHSGEYSGLRLKILRLFFATLHEFFEFLEISEKVFEDRRIKDLLNKCPRQTQELWGLLIKIAKNDEIDSIAKNFVELSQQLLQIRNNVGFHYQTKNRLIEGFARFFYGKTKIPDASRKWAYWTGMRTKFSTTRFYYGDAALQGYLLNIFGDEESAKDKYEKAFKLLAMIARAISDLLLEYHATLPNR